MTARPGPAPAAAHAFDAATAREPVEPPVAALRVHRLEELRGDALEEAILRIQASLRPGGRADVAARRGGRRLARRLRPYFEGGVAGPGERFRPVRAERDGGLWRVAAWRRGPGLTAGHFENLASEYRDELPAHVVDHFLARKVRAIRDAIASDRPRRVLDLGCGMGDYARAVARESGAEVVAVDASPQAVRVAARQPGAAWAAADAERLPFADASFDAAYAINMLHHLKRGQQEAALAEARRVLRPGGLLLVLEINVRNPLFRLYMRHVFPRTRRIDRGDEEFLDPRRLPLPPGLRLEGVAYSTFLPDFVPRWAVAPARGLERFLESTPARPWAIHFQARLRRTEGEA